MSQSAKEQQTRINPPVETWQQLTDDLYREIFVHSREAIAIISPDGRYIEQNGAHYKLLGYSNAELHGQTPAIHLGEPVFAKIARELAETGTFHGEVISHTRDGKERHVDLSAFAMRDGVGQPICYVGIKRDITERRRAQQRLAMQYAVTRVLSDSSDFTVISRDLLQTICESLGWEVGALWRVNSKTNQLHCVEFWHAPQAAVETFEALSRKRTFEKGPGLPGRIWSWAAPVWVPNVLEDSNFPRASVAESVGIRGAFGFPILIGNEVLGVIEFFSRETREPDDELLNVVTGIGRQIGQFIERTRAERELELLLGREQAARADAEKANRLKDEFLATLSHELRTPLNAVIGWARMLRTGRLDKPSSVHALEVIERNAWAQQQIIEDILDVSRVVTGKLQLHLGPVRINSVIEAALDAVRPALQAKEIRVETAIDDHLKIISGDADRLQQVVWNLLSNAAKYTPNGGCVEIHVSQGTAQTEISVTDSGAGIEPEFLPHVFERFRQADGSTTRTHGGLGLGLAIVRHLVELHGGTISAENRKEGKSGAIFTVKLPLPSGELKFENLPESSAHQESNYGPTTFEGLHILVVDDDVDTLDLITIELTQHGASVKAVNSGAEALEAFKENNFDVLIADIGMPGIDGYELISQIRRSETSKATRIPAVALTAYARVQDRMRAVIAGYNTHAAKPIETNELLTVVASLAGRLDKD
ncbi:MAG TPA: ATP-binding protein [Pyrinomonadaceae bacterium]|nr:ATP-binding protein [Pyrinomonadaceae bacterium]